MRKVTVLNTATGRVGVVRESFLRNPLYNRVLVEVKRGKKSYVMWKPRTAKEYLAQRADLIE